MRGAPLAEGDGAPRCGEGAARWGGPAERGEPGGRCGEAEGRAPELPTQRPSGLREGDRSLSGLPGCRPGLPALAAPSPSFLPLPPHPGPFPRIPAQPGPVPFSLPSPLCSGLSLRKSVSFCAVAAQKKLQINFCHSGACGFSAGKIISVSQGWEAGGVHGNSRSIVRTQQCLCGSCTDSSSKSLIIVNFCSVPSSFTILFVSFSCQQILRREERRKCVQYWINFFVMLLRLERRCKCDCFGGPQL